MVGLPVALDCEFLNTPAKGNPMTPDIQRTALRMRTAVDANGNRYELQEWQELVRFNLNGRWSPFELYHKHGEAMTCNGVNLERISSTQWSLGYPPLELTLLE